MSDAARRKERQRIKREKKKAQHRRVMSVSPYKRIGQVGRIEACYINANWQESGVATIHLIRQNPQGGLALACFLIDLWCAGLKDAWGFLDMTSDETDRHVKNADDQFELLRIDPDVARQFVAGAIRFARQNGFRLPAHFDRWTNVLGDLPDTVSADLRPFGKDGGLLWVGSMDDLRRRLIGCSVEEFLAKPNVDFISEADGFGDGDSDDEFDGDLDEENDELDERLDEMADEIFEKTHQRCLDRGEMPSPLMHDAIRGMLMAMSITAAAEAELENSPARVEADNLMNQLEEYFRSNPQIDFPQEMKDAVQQLFRVVEMEAEPLPENAGGSPDTAKA